MKRGWRNFWKTIIILSVIGIALCIGGIVLGAYHVLPLQVGETSLYISSSGIGFYLSDEQAAELADDIEDDIEDDIGDKLEEELEELGEKIKESLDSLSGIRIEIDVD